ncbi:DUF167 family protein [Methanopyrus sp.]
MTRDPFQHHPEGTLLQVRVNPDADETRIKGVDEWRGALEIDVSEPPVKGRANRELLRYLRERLDADVELVSGERSREKQVLVKGLEPDEVRERLGV